MLPRNQRQEALSRAYVQAVAAHCGLMCSVREPDYGVNLTLHYIRHRDGRYGESGFRVDLQLKSTTRSGVTDADFGLDGHSLRRVAVDQSQRGTAFYSGLCLLAVAARPAADDK